MVGESTKGGREMDAGKEGGLREEEKEKRERE